LIGGSETDTASYFGSENGVTVDLSAGTGQGGDAEGDTLDSIENVKGSSKDDHLIGNSIINKLDGGDGNDTLTGGEGADELIGGIGADTAKYEGSSAGVTIDLSAGTASGGDADGDNLSGIENLVGSSQDDYLTGDGGDNELEGGSGFNALDGSEGDDVLVGGKDGNVLVGGDGIDTLTGGAGSDILITGSLVDASAGGEWFGTETVKGNGGGDYIVLNDHDGSDFTLEGGNTADRISLMPHMAGKSQAADGSLPLFTIAGGTYEMKNSYVYQYPGTEIVMQNIDKNIRENENGETYKNFLYNDPSGLRLKFSLYSEALFIKGNYGGKSFYITINGFQDGDYGIQLTEHHVGDTVDFYDRSNSFRYIVDEAGVAANEEQLRRIADISDSLTLTSDLQIVQPQQRMASFAAFASTAPASLNADKLVVQVSGSSGDDNLVGTDIKERFIGSDGKDVIDAMGGDDTLNGGTGADIMYGGAGNDTYQVDDVGDIVSEESNFVDQGGIDTVSTQLNSYTLNTYFENLTFNGSGGFVGTGNSLNNVITGSFDNDVLTGGAGADTLLGGAGNDRIVYDAADLAANVNGGADSDTLVVVGGSLPTGFNLVASAFEQAEWQQTDNAGQSWSTIVGRYNSNWQITSSSTKFDNGIEREMLHDYTAPINWQSRQLDYAAPSAGGALIYDYFVFDDLSNRDTSYDTDLATAYKSIRNDYNAAGDRTYLHFVFEDNSGRDTTLDYTTDIVWQSQRNDYDASGFRTYNYYVFDDGTSRDTSLDNTAGVVWQSLRQDYGVNGAMNYQYYVFDDNTSRQVVIDAANQFSWNTQVTNYNAAGQVVEFFQT
jgi:trimeric autotransporter adhesin